MRTKMLTRKPKTGDKISCSVLNKNGTIGDVAYYANVLSVENGLCYFLKDVSDKSDSFIWRFKDNFGKYYYNRLFTIVE